MDKYRRYLNGQAEKAKCYIAIMRSYKVYKDLFVKMMRLKDVRYREFAEKYYGGILKRKTQYSPCSNLLGNIFQSEEGL